MKIDDLADEFTRVEDSVVAVMPLIPEDKLYWKPFQSKNHLRIYSCGELVSHSMGTIEAACNGILNNFWDDPFEWTLPEQLSAPATVVSHLLEVEETRKHAFASFTDDSCLLKSVATPAHGLVSLIELLLKTLLRAMHFQSQAVVVLKVLSGISPSGFII